MLKTKIVIFNFNFYVSLITFKIVNLNRGYNLVFGRRKLFATFIKYKLFSLTITITFFHWLYFEYPLKMCQILSCLERLNFCLYVVQALKTFIRNQFFPLRHSY